MTISSKKRTIQSVVLLSLAVILLLLIVTYYKAKERNDKIIITLENIYLDAEWQNRVHFNNTDKRLAAKGVKAGLLFSSLLDSLSEKYSFKFLPRVQWAPGLLHQQQVTIDVQDQLELRETMQAYCAGFDSLFRQTYTVVYKDTIPLKFERASEALQNLRQMIPQDGYVKMHESFDLNDINGHEFALIFSEWVFRNSDFLNAYSLDMLPVHEKLCAEVYRKLNTVNNEK